MFLSLEQVQRCDERIVEIIEREGSLFLRKLKKGKP
jgi:hypothetical protein